MNIIPAIDIKNSSVVRLTKGKFDSHKVYSESPVEVAKKWEKFGTTYLHLINLDGAESGKFKNRNCIKKILESTDLKVQVGGGIRNREVAEDLLELGAQRIIIGTLVREKKEVFKQLLKSYNERIIVAVDTKKSTVMLKGWEESSKINYLKYVEKLEELGVRRIIFTDILKDGTLSKPNFLIIKKLLGSTTIPVIASGGISNYEDVEKLYDLSTNGLEGVIIGKALYENKISLQKCLREFES